MTGTPSLLTADGQMIPGYVPPEQLQARLDQMAAAPKREIESERIASGTMCLRQTIIGGRRPLSHRGPKTTAGSKALSEFTCLLGEPALSDFRARKLIRRIADAAGFEPSLDARFVYLIESSAPFESAALGALEDLLHGQQIARPG